MKYVLALLLVGLPTAAVAQTEPVPDDRNVELQLFEPAVGTHAYLTVSGAEVMSKGQFQLGLGVNYMTHPLSVYTVDAMDGLESRSQVVDSIFSGNLIFAYGLANNLQAGINLPVILSMTGDGLDSSTGMPEAGGLSVNGLGDARIELAWRAYDNESLVVAVIPAMTVPTSLNLGGDTDAFLGDDLPTFRPRGAVELTGDRFSAAANLGVILRKTRYLYSSEIGQQITYGVAAALHVTRRFDILAEVFGRKGFANDLDESPLEGDLAVKIGATPALSILLGGGTGIIQGFGAPEARVFASVSWAPDFRDNDGDGLSNMADRCPNQAEDKDKYKDDDGCPEVDNDDDGVADAQDRCPLEREDLDGFADEDGCPDGDNDADGIADEKDGCPRRPRTSCRRAPTTAARSRAATATATTSPTTGTSVRPTSRTSTASRTTTAAPIRTTTATPRSTVTTSAPRPPRTRTASRTTTAARTATTTATAWPTPPTAVRRSARPSTGSRTTTAAPTAAARCWRRCRATAWCWPPRWPSTARGSGRRARTRSTRRRRT
jgi:hypothetical protein